MRVFQPFDYLIAALWLGGCSHDLSVCLKYLCPELNFILGRPIGSKRIAPPVREPLQSGALGGSQSADDVVRLLGYRRRILEICGDQRFRHIIIRKIGVEGTLA